MDECHTGSKIDQRFVQNLGGTDANVLSFHIGNVGIGTTSPDYKLDVNSGVLRIANGTGSDYGSRNDGIAFSRTDFLTSYSNKITNSLSNVASDTGMDFELTNTAGSGFVNVLSLRGNGFVGIGTTTPKEALSVNGNIRSQQVKVEMNNWPDYVFKPAYSLPSLLEVKTYINKYQHLPDMPSEAEVAKDGLNLGEINKLLTKKVEELTLYLIEEHKKNDDQQEQLNELKQQMAAIIKTLNKN